jgi:hypothetical protein
MGTESAEAPSPMLKQISVALLGVAVLGCGVEAQQARVPPEGEPTPTAAQELRRIDDDGVIIANGLATSDLLLNPLTVNSNRVKKLRTNSLRSAFADPEMVQGVEMSNASKSVLTYLAQCALKESDTLSVNGVPYRGRYGVCVDWLNAPPSATCLELVTACMLARNNPSQRHERLSLRGEPLVSDSWRYVAQSSVRAQSWSGGPEVLSLRTAPACDGMPNGKARDCGWRALPVQTCPRDTSVVLGFGGRDPGVPGSPSACSLPTTYGSQSAGMDMMIRVCSGDQPCDRLAALAASDFTCGSIRPAVRVTCPPSGRVTVMTAPYSVSTGDGTPTLGASPSVGTMTEVEAFPIREGAFFGNMFDETKLGAEVEWLPQQAVKVTWKVGVDGAVYGDTYSCADDKWATNFAYQSTRTCAAPRDLPDRRCLSKRLGPCSATCTINDGPAQVGDFDFEGCSSSPGRGWSNPLTSFLVDACDLMPVNDKTACKRLP